MFTKKYDDVWQANRYEAYFYLAHCNFMCMNYAPISKQKEEKSWNPMHKFWLSIIIIIFLSGFWLSIFGVITKSKQANSI